MKSYTWNLTFKQSISGVLLVSARRPHQKTLHGAEIPKYVQDYCLVQPVPNPDTLPISEESLSVVKDKGTLIEGGWEVSEEIPIPYASRSAKYGEAPHLDWDEASYLGNGNDGVYYGALKTSYLGPRGGKRETWWAMATVDSDTGGFVDDTGGFVDTLAADPGYSSEKHALRAAKDAAFEWCASNGICTDPNCQIEGCDGGCCDDSP